MLKWMVNVCLVALGLSVGWGLSQEAQAQEQGGDTKMVCHDLSHGWTNDTLAMGLENNGLTAASNHIVVNKNGEKYSTVCWW